MDIVPLKKQEKLSLTNDGKLEVFFLGTGSAFAATNYQTNFLLIKGDTHVMVDFGMTGNLALHDIAGLSPTDIEVILPTHSHADHVGGIECLALMNRYVGMRMMDSPKLKMVINENYQRVLWTHTLQGGLEWNENGPQNAQKLQFHDFFDVIRPRWKAFEPREVLETTVGDIKIEMFRTVHIPEQATDWESSFISYGLYVDDRVFLSCDTKFNSDLIYYYAGKSEVMFHDVQFFQGAVHASLNDLKTLDPVIKQKMYLMHYSDNYQEQDIEGFAGWAKPKLKYTFN